MSDPKRKPTSDADRAHAQAEIEHLIASPRPKRASVEVQKWADDTGNPIARQAVDSLRRKLAADRGLTVEQWIEMEANVSHPRDVVSITPSPRMIARRRMTQAGVPARFIEAVADKEPLDCDPMRDVRAFLDSQDGFRVLSGGKGTRKTGSASWALGQLDGGTFLEAGELTRLSIEQRPKWEAVIASPLVVLDDLGTERRDEKGAFNAALSELINKVYSQRRRLIVTCNLSRDTFKSVYGEREYDRMREAGKWSTVKGDSARQYEMAVRQPGEDDD